MTEKIKEKYNFDTYLNNAEEYVHNEEKSSRLIETATRKSNKNKGALENVWDNLSLLIQMFKAWSKGDYKFPKRTILAVIATVLYFVSPIDVVPDFIVALGFVDDAAVIGFTIKQISKDLENFQAWRQSHPELNNKQ